LLPTALARAQPGDFLILTVEAQNLIGQGLISMSMIDPKGSRPSALVNLAGLQPSANLKLVKTEAREDSDPRISSSNDNYLTDIIAG
jgi:hypothetical protein